MQTRADRLPRLTAIRSKELKLIQHTKHTINVVSGPRDHSDVIRNISLSDDQPPGSPVRLWCITSVL